MKRGYIKLWRKIDDSGLLRDAGLCQMFLHLLLHAATTPRTVLLGRMTVAVAPGQVIVGRKKLSAALGLSERAVRTCLAVLERRQVISQQPTNRYTVVSILNWQRYQGGSAGTRDAGLNARPHVGQSDQTNDRPSDRHNSGTVHCAAPYPGNGGCESGQQNDRRGDPQTTTNKNIKNTKNTSTTSMPGPRNPRAAHASGGADDGAGGGVAGVTHAGSGADDGAVGTGHASGGASGGAGRGAGGGDEAGALPPLEFRIIREHYDARARQEAPMTGYREYLASRAAGVWPGQELVLEAIDRLAAHDASWLRGYAPGLSRFIGERQWQKKPAAASPAFSGSAPGSALGSAPGSAPGWANTVGDATIAKNLANVQAVLARRRNV